MHPLPCTTRPSVHHWVASTTDGEMVKLGNFNRLVAADGFASEM